MEVVRWKGGKSYLGGGERLFDLFVFGALGLVEGWCKQFFYLNSSAVGSVFRG